MPVLRKKLCRFARLGFRNLNPACLRRDAGQLFLEAELLGGTTMASSAGAAGATTAIIAAQNVANNTSTTLPYWAEWLLLVVGVILLTVSIGTLTQIWRY